MIELFYKKECFEIMSCCFEVFNVLGFGLREKNYQKAIEQVLSTRGIPFKSQLYVPLKIEGKTIGKYYLDFLVDDKIAIELKAGDHFLKRDIYQLLAYLKSTNLILGLLVNFTSHGVEFKRIINTP